ncbi:hypothetical protein HG530_013306 [Fusarium avenaceum]|nr:hypothetical protein HG530_013306 [Fusarium avenaceum]
MSLIISAHFHGVPISGLSSVLHVPVFPAHYSTDPRISAYKLFETFAQFCFFYVSRAIRRVGDKTYDDLFLWPPARDDGVVVVRLAHVAPSTIELRECDEEGLPKVGFQMVDQTDYTAQRHGFFNIEIQPVEFGPGNHLSQRLVPSVEALQRAVKLGVRALRRASKHAEHFYAGRLELTDFIPQWNELI